MIIGLDISAMGGKNTGTSRYIQCLLSQLNKTEHEIKTFPIQSIDRLPKSNILNSIPFIKRGGINRHLYRTFLLSSDMYNAKVDFGIFPNYLMPLNFNKPSLIIIHDLSFYSHPDFYSKAFVFYYKNQLTKIMKKNPLIVTISEHSKEMINKYLGVDKNKIHLLQPYVDASIFSKNHLTNHINAESPYFLYVGHIEPRKNLLFMIENFVSWKSKNSVKMKLKIAGEIWQNSEEIQNMMKRYSHHPDVEFTGYVEELELHQLYQNAAGFVHSSFVEGFGFPVLEAMHYGLPVLCSSGTSTEEISQPHSFTFHPSMCNEMLMGFDRLYIAAQSEKQKYKIEYSPEQMADQLNSILSTVIQKENIIFYLNRAHHDEVENAIEKTLLYYKLFNSGLEFESLHPFLHDIKVTREQIDDATESLLMKNAITINNNKMILNTEIDSFYTKKNKSIDPRLVKRLLKVLNKIPFITLIAFSGGTANYGINNHDDIDLFIITKPYSVYIVYLLIHAISLLFKSRNIVCVNYLIDEKEIVINTPNDLYVAHQIMSLKPFKNDEYLNFFISKNNWVTNFYPNYKIPESSHIQSSSLYRINSLFNWALNKMYRKWYQKFINSSGDGNVILSEHVIKLHTQDYRKKILEEFDIQWSRYIESKNTNDIIQALAK
ncbi:MAG: glycosyltransferase family 1 protein [Ignavibacteriales bacterium]|nr:glycosyltransferase family 1 protein [Ignavibacteriales bacterium]